MTEKWRNQQCWKRWNCSKNHALPLPFTWLEDAGQFFFSDFWAPHHKAYISFCSWCKSHPFMCVQRSHRRDNPGARQTHTRRRNASPVIRVKKNTHLNVAHSKSVSEGQDQRLGCAAPEWVTLQLMYFKKMFYFQTLWLWTHQSSHYCLKATDH